MCLHANRPALVVCTQLPDSTDTAVPFHAAHAEWLKKHPTTYSRDEEPVATCADPAKRHWVCMGCYTRLCAERNARCPVCRAPLERKKRWLKWSTQHAIFWNHGYHALACVMASHDQDVNECLGPYKVSLLFEVVRSIRHLNDINFSYTDRLQCVCMLLRRGANANKRNKRCGGTLLHMAAHVDPYGRVVRALLAAGAGVDAVDKYGNTALHLAARSNHVASVCVILKHGALLKIDTPERDTPLHVATRHGHFGVVSAICKSVLDNRGADALRRLQRMQNAHGATAATYASNFGVLSDVIVASLTQTPADMDDVSLHRPVPPETAPCIGA